MLKDDKFNIFEASMKKTNDNNKDSDTANTLDLKFCPNKDTMMVLPLSPCKFHSIQATVDKPLQELPT